MTSRPYEVELRHIEAELLIVHARSGAHIGDCIREAAMLALAEWRNVRLMHNGSAYEIKVNDLLAQVGEMSSKGQPIKR